jgi:hypothetical protein
MAEITRVFVKHDMVWPKKLVVSAGRCSEEPFFLERDTCLTHIPPCGAWDSSLSRFLKKSFLDLENTIPGNECSKHNDPPYTTAYDNEPPVETCVLRKSFRKKECKRLTAFKLQA